MLYELILLNMYKDGELPEEGLQYLAFARKRVKIKNIFYVSILLSAVFGLSGSFLNPDIPTPMWYTVGTVLIFGTTFVSGFMYLHSESSTRRQMIQFIREHKEILNILNMNAKTFAEYSNHDRVQIVEACLTDLGHKTQRLQIHQGESAATPTREQFKKLHQLAASLNIVDEPWDRYFPIEKL